MAASRFATLLDTFHPDPNTRGKQWEHVCKWFLKNDLLYRALLTDVWPWDEWPGREGRETGIDLVAETPLPPVDPSWARRCSSCPLISRRTSRYSTHS
jgi:hypothetical protein